MNKIRTLILLSGLVIMGSTLRSEISPPTSSLKVEIKIGTGIDKSEVTGEADTFSADVERVVGWTLVEGAAEPTQISHIWIYKGNEIAPVTLPVKSAHFRTYSRKIITGFPGTWTLQVRDESGNVLGEKKFEVTASAEPSSPPQ